MIPNVTTTFRCPSDILITSWLFTARWSTWLKNHHDTCMFISHDVVSLFTNTPINLALQFIRELLEGDTKLHTRTRLTVEDIMDLFKFIVTTAYFSFRGVIYQQMFGATMGSPVSPLLANLFMEWLEEQAIATTPVECKLSGMWMMFWNW